MQLNTKSIKNLPAKSLKDFEKFVDNQKAELFYKFLKNTDWINESSGVIDRDLFYSFFDETDKGTLYFFFEKLLAKYPSDEILTMFSTVFDSDYIDNKRNQFNDRVVDRNSTWERNHAIIANTFYELTKQSVSLPLVSEIAQKTGLSRTTIYKHLEHLETDNHYKTQKAFWQFGLQSVASVAYQLGMKRNDLKALKLFADIASKQIEKPKQVNYIQINNTKIDVNQLESLAPEQQQQIIQILEGSQESDTLSLPMSKVLEMPKQTQDSIMTYISEK